MDQNINIIIFRFKVAKIFYFNFSVLNLCKKIAVTVDIQSQTKLNKLLNEEQTFL